MNIKNLACFNQIAKLFNLEKTFCSFFQSDFNDIVDHKKFLELDVVFFLKLLQKPNFPRWYVTRPVIRSNGSKMIKYAYYEITEKLDIAVNKWVNHNIEERQKYEEIINATIRQFLDKADTEFNKACKEVMKSSTGGLIDFL